jgi:ABC-type glycerol-3-phosphate transport system substrate-binding protein
MNPIKPLLFCAFLGALPSAAWSETVIGILHIQSNPQIRAICQDITKAVSEVGFKDTFYPATVQNFTVDGKIYGVPNDLGPIVFWYNKDLCQKAGIDPAKIQNWEDFVDAVKKCLAADAIQDPLMKSVAQEVDKSQWIAIAMDQLLGPDTGRVFNDVSADIASGNTTPEKAVKAIEDSWKQNKAQ